MKPTLPSSANGNLLGFSEEAPLLIDVIQDYAIFALGPEGEIRSWNKGAARIMGYDAAEVIGKKFSIFYGDSDREIGKPEHELVVAAREGRIEDEGWRIRKDGTRFWANTVITALRNADGSTRGFAKITRDLTQRRAAEERLRRSEEMFRLLVSSVKDYAIFMLDPNGYIVTWNAGAERLKGYKPDEIIGKHFSVFYPEDNREWPNEELEIAKRDGSIEDEGWRIRKDGSRFWADVIITAVHDEHGELRGFAKVTRDVTDRKQSEETQKALIEQREARVIAEEERRRVEAAYRASEEANRAKDDFLMTLSHELRTPMTAILGWTRMLPSMKSDEPMFRDALAAIMRSADLQAQLIDDVLDVSRIISGKLRLSLENVDVERVLNAAVETVRPSADAKTIALVTEISPAIGTMVADPTRLQQVVWNLLTNAVKFTPRNGRITLKAHRTSSHLLVTVVDTGEGIEPTFLPHIFEPFRQAEDPRTRMHSGLGLGLSIVRYLVEAHGGTVSAESEGKGKGASFKVTLPIASLRVSPAVTDSPAESGPKAFVPSQRLKGVQILLIDDDAEGRYFVRSALQRAGAAVNAVESAPHALAELKARKPDLLLTDIAMPHMDGYALVRQIRSNPAQAAMKVVALSAFPAGTAAAKQSGFDAYLTKPIDPTTLVDELAKILGLP